MKLFYVRHQAAGVVFDSPFMTEPTQAQVDKVLARVAETLGTNHVKTKKPYWAKVVSVDTDVPGEFTTVRCASGDDAESVDAKASGECPIREAGLERWPEAEDPESEDAKLRAGAVTAVGTVENPE